MLASKQNHKVGKSCFFIKGAKNPQEVQPPIHLSSAVCIVHAVFSSKVVRIYLASLLINHIPVFRFRKRRIIDARRFAIIVGKHIFKVYFTLQYILGEFDLRITLLSNISMTQHQQNAGYAGTAAEAPESPTP